MRSLPGFRRCLSLAAALVVFSSSYSLNAQTSADGSATSSYRVGAESITIPSPSDKLEETGSDYRVLMYPFVPDSNRLVAAYVTPADLSSIKSGTAPLMDTYAMVEVPRRAEFVDITPAIFAEVTATMGKQFGAETSAALPEEQVSLNRKLQAVCGACATVALGKPVQLGALFAEPNVVGYGMIMPVTAKGTSRNMVMAMAVVRVRNRILFGYLYAVYQSQVTVKLLQSSGKQWADAIVADNQ